MTTSGRIDAALNRYRAGLAESGVAEKIGFERVEEQVADVRRFLGVVPQKQVRTSSRNGRTVQVSASSGLVEGVGIGPVRGFDGHVDVEASLLNSRLLRDVLATPVHGTWLSRRLQAALARCSRRVMDPHLDAFARNAYESTD